MYVILAYNNDYLNDIYMTLLLIILICIVLVVIILQIVAFIRNGRKAPEEPKAPTLDAEGLKLILEQMNSQLNNQLNNINVSVDQKMSNIGQSMSENMHLMRLTAKSLVLPNNCRICRIF